MVNAIASRSVSGSMRPFLDGVVYFIAYLLLDFFHLVSKKKKKENNKPFEYFLKNFEVKIQNFFNKP